MNSNGESGHLTIIAWLAASDRFAPMTSSSFAKTVRRILCIVVESHGCAKSYYELNAFDVEWVIT